jgi:hypothetical protein
MCQTLYYEKQQQEQDVNSEKVEVALYGMLNELHKQLQESEPQENLKPPSVVNVKKSAPVFMETRLREREITRLGNLNTRFEKNNSTRKLWKTTPNA